MTENWFPPPKRDDDATAKRWRGPLFWRFRSTLTWKERPPDKDYSRYEFLQSPQSVTFPICAMCHHVIWEWPFFEETPPANAICDQCCKDEENAQ
jgi:hypothetical protein